MTHAAKPLPRDAALRRRAERVIPGGMWGHMNVARLPTGYPQYFSHARDCRLWDVDGNEYIDLMCSYGPIILGHADPDVERAAAAQRERGDVMTGPSDLLVELAETLVDTVAHADWAMLAKNGSDATTSCVTIARAGTGKRKVLVARGAYHGSVPWCSPSVAGRHRRGPRPSDRVQLQRREEPGTGGRALGRRSRRHRGQRVQA